MLVIMSVAVPGKPVAHTFGLLRLDRAASRHHGLLFGPLGFAGTFKGTRTPFKGALEGKDRSCGPLLLMLKSLHELV